MRISKKAQATPTDTLDKGGRPRKEIDAKLVEQLASIQCTDLEIAAICGVSHDTLLRRKNDDPEFLEMLEQGRAKGRVSLRRMQWKAATTGNPTMLIWLGKQLLGQRDKAEEATEDTLDKARQIRDAIKAMNEVETGQETAN